VSINFHLQFFEGKFAHRVKYGALTSFLMIPYDVGAFFIIEAPGFG